MKAHGILKGKNIVLEKIPDDKKLTEGSKVEVIILPLKSKKHLFRTFKLGIKKEHLAKEKIYAKN
jgi:hypothetical protein